MAVRTEHVSDDLYTPGTLVPRGRTRERATVLTVTGRSTETTKFSACGMFKCSLWDEVTGVPLTLLDLDIGCSRVLQEAWARAGDPGPVRELTRHEMAALEEVFFRAHEDDGVTVHYATYRTPPAYTHEARMAELADQENPSEF